LTISSKSFCSFSVTPTPCISNRRSARACAASTRLSTSARPSVGTVAIDASASRSNSTELIKSTATTK